MIFRQDKYYVVSPYIRIINGQIVNYLGETINNNEYIEEILIAVKEKRTLKRLYSLFDKKIVNYLVEQKIILRRNELEYACNFISADIEVNTHCNRRCEYCPSSFDIVSKRIMDMTLFKKILNRINEEKSIKYITFNRYNEPTLDPYFEKRLFAIKKLTNCRLVLYTNGINLTKKQLETIKKLNILEYICFNLPSLNKNIYESMTKDTNFDKIIENIELVKSMGLTYTFSVQGLENTVSLTKKELLNTYNISEKQIFIGTSDRAGSLKNEYFKNIQINKEYLFGCNSIINNICIDVDGNTCLCPHDYNKKYFFGNLKSQSIHNIFASPHFISVKKQIFGMELADKDLLCRNCVLMDENIVSWRLNKRFFDSY